MKPEVVILPDQYNFVNTFGSTMKFLSLYKDTHIIFWAPDEMDTWQNVKKYQDHINKICLDRKNTVEFWEGNFYKQEFVSNKTIKVVNWSNFFITYALKFNYLEQHNKKPDTLFISLNRSALPHKCKFIDTLAKHDLIKDNIVSWHKQGYNIKYNFEYFDNNKLIIDDINYQEALHTYPQEYRKAYIDLICESFSNKPDISEKTFKAIAAKKVFLSIGYRGLYRQLKDLGFKLYTEIFDYEFDNFKYFDDRVENAVYQISRLKNYDRIYPKVNHKIEYNYNHFLKLAHQVPKEFLTFIHKHDVPFYKDLFGYFKET